MRLILCGRLVSFSMIIVMVINIYLIDEMSAQNMQRKVLVIGIDGMRPDAMEIADTPHITSLYKDGNGLYFLGYNEDLTFSGPNWSTIIHGVHHDRHGVISNTFDGHDFSQFPNFLRRLKDFDPDLYTASFIAWDPLLNNFTLEDGSTDGVDMLFHYEGGDSYETENDELLTESLVELLNDGNPDAIFIRIGELDGAGHRHNFSPHSEKYMLQVEKTDMYIGRIIKALNSRPEVINGSENWLVIFTTDHGGIGTGHSGNYFRQRIIPFIVSGSSVITEKPLIRPRNVDVARTVLTFMGVPEIQQTDLDGHPVGLKSDNVSQSDYGVNLIINGDAEFDRGFKDRGRDQAISGWKDQEYTGSKDGYHSMTVLQYGIGDGYPNHNSPGPSERGVSFFAGGSKGNSSKMTQWIDLLPFQADINKLEVKYHLSGFIGGSGNSADFMTFSAYFLDKNHQIIESAILDTVTLSDRDGVDGLWYEEVSAGIPPNTRSVLLELHALSACDDQTIICIGINAFADDLSFSLEYNP